MAGTPPPFPGRNICPDCGGPGAAVRCRRCQKDFCNACVIDQPPSLPEGIQALCVACAAQVPGAITERGATPQFITDDTRIGARVFSLKHQREATVKNVQRWTNGYEWLLLAFDGDSFAKAAEPKDVQFLSKDRSNMQQPSQVEREKHTMQSQKQGFFSRFFGRGGPQPHSADMNYDDLYLDDDTDGPADAALAPSASSRASDVTFPSPRRAQKLTTSNMTQEQLRTRRTNVIEGSKFGRPAHENFMLFLLRFWLLIGPIAFVILTTSEVAYILTSLTAPGDKSTLIITGGALFIDLAMMFTTFGVAIKRRDQAEKREANGGVLAKREEAEVWFGTALWLVFAAINIIGQSAFLLHIIGASGARDMTILYIFVASRVVGFILGDASTAFFLAGVDNSHLKLIARGEREKASLYSDISKAEGERRLIEAKAEAEIILLEIKVQQERDDALFLADLKKQAFGAALGNRPQLPPAEEPSGPNKTRLRRLDSN